MFTTVAEFKAAIAAIDPDLDAFEIELPDQSLAIVAGRMIAKDGTMYYKTAGYVHLDQLASEKLVDDKKPILGVPIDAKPPDVKPVKGK